MSKVERLIFLTISVCLLLAEVCLAVNVDISKYPFLVALRYKNDISSPYKHVCSGSIYNDTTVIIAASCFNNDLTPLSYQIVAGSNILDGNQGGVVLIDHIVTHYAYSANSATNDIAVVFLRNKLPLDGAKIVSVELATQELYAGSLTSVIGWKRNAPAGSLLQSFMIAISSKSSCLDGSATDSNEIICGNSGDICTQGPGSLLLHTNALAGILSANNDCKGNTHYYTNVVEFKDWLERTLRGEIITMPKPAFL